MTALARVAKVKGRIADGLAVIERHGRTAPNIGLGLDYELFILSRVSSAAGWGDRHRLALIFGMSLAGMLGGTLLVVAFGPLDRLGKFGFDLLYGS